MALPCFHKVRNRFPDADITLLTNRPVMAKAAPLEAVLGKNIFFNRVLDYPVGTRNIWSLFLLLKHIRSLKIDTVVNLTAARSKVAIQRDKLFFYTAGVKELIGFPEVKSDFEVCPDPETGIFEWEAKRLARRINALGSIALKAQDSWDLKLSESELEAACRALENSSPNTSRIAISLGTKLQANDWGINNWVSLLKLLRVALPGWDLLIVGAADEAKLANICLEVWGIKGFNLCGKFSPRVSAAVLRQAKIFIGHDSGPLHLAACVGTPCIGIFSARNMPGQWFPRGGSNKILYHQAPCAGCRLEVCIEKKKKCILSITVDEVYQAAMTVLNEQTSSMLNSSKGLKSV